MTTDKKKKILIIEDEERIARIYKKNLTSAGFDTELVHNTEDAENLLDSFSADLLLLDHGLAGNGESGIDAIPKLKKKVPEATIIVFSNYSVFNLRDEALAAGADDYWLKLDFPLSSLVERVKSLV